MLDAFIIEELRKREKAEEQAQEDNRPRLEIPADDIYNDPRHHPNQRRRAPGHQRRDRRDDEGSDRDSSDRGVVTIDL